MFSLTLPSGESGWLILYPPEMGAGASFRVRAKDSTERGATGREGRRPTDPTLCLELDWQAELGFTEVAAVRDGLRAYQNEPIAMPCWPLARAGVDYVYGTTPQGGYMIAWNESGSYQFFTGAVTSPTSWDWIAPAIYGFFSDTPRALATQGDFVRYAFKFVEDSPASWALGPFNASAGVSGPSIGSYTPPGFPFELDWATSPESGAAGVSVAREEVGPGRRRLQTFFPNLPERIVKGQITVSDPWPLICWWYAQGGGAQSQWVSTWLAAGLLVSDAASGATAVVISPQSGVVADAILAFDCNGTLFFRKVASVSGTTVNLTSSLPVLCEASFTTVSLAMLGRHISDTIEIFWSSPDCFSAKLDWQELAQEYATPSGETLGITIGRKYGRPYLLEISSAQPVSEVLLRLTDWSSGITASGNFFTPAALDVGERSRNVDLSDQTMKITLPWSDGTPLLNFLPGSSYRRLFAKLFYVPVSPAGSVGSPVQDWYGEIVDAEWAGPRIEIEVAGPSKVFDRQIPSDQFCMTCNAHLFDQRCGVSRAAWTVSATVVSSVGNSVIVNAASRPGGAMTPLQDLNAFSLGTLQWTVGGVTKISGIYASSYATGFYTFTLREPTGIPLSTAVTVIPGCDLQWLGGCARYSGKLRGFPYIPARAPQFQIPTQQTSSGKK